MNGRMEVLLENKAAVIYGGWVTGLKSSAPEIVDMFITIGADQWFRYVTGAVAGPASEDSEA